MRQGLTYDTYQHQIPPPEGSGILFFVYFETRDYGWWSCYGKKYTDSASFWYRLTW